MFVFDCILCYLDEWMRMLFFRKTAASKLRTQTVSYTLGFEKFQSFKTEILYPDLFTLQRKHLVKSLLIANLIRFLKKCLDDKSALRKISNMWSVFTHMANSHVNVLEYKKRLVWYTNMARRVIVFLTPTWLPCDCFLAPIWLPWRHVKTRCKNGIMIAAKNEIKFRLMNALFVIGRNGWPILSDWPTFKQSISTTVWWRVLEKKFLRFTSVLEFITFVKHA